MSQTGLKTGDLDLDLNVQGQIGLETKQFCVIPCGYNNIWEYYLQSSAVY